MPMFIPSESLNAEPMTRVDAPELKDFTGEEIKGLGTAVMGAGDATIKIGQRLQRDYDIAQAKAADNQLASFDENLLHDPDTGYLGKLKKDAIDTRTDVLKSRQDAYDKINDGLDNDVQRMMFDKTARLRTQHTQQLIDAHAMNQVKAYQHDELQAGLNVAIDAAVRNYPGWNQQDSQFSLEKARIEASVNGIADNAGVPRDSDQHKEMQQAALTKVHTMVLDQMIVDEQPKQAQEYFDANKGQIDPSKYAELTQKIQNGNSYVDGKAAGDRIFAERMKDISIDDAIPEEQMIRDAEALDLKNRGREYAVARVRDLVSRYNIQKTADTHAVSNTMHGMMTNDNDRGEYTQVVNFLNGRTDIDETSRGNLLSAADHFYHISEDRQIAKTEAAFQRSVTAAIATQNYLNDYVNGKLEDGKKLTKQDILTNYSAELGPNVFQFANIVEKINAKLENPKVTMADFNNKLRTMYAIPEFKDQLGFDPFSKSPDAIKKKLLLLDSTLDAMSSMGAKGPGKQISLDQAIQSALQPVKVPGILWDSTYKSYEVPHLSPSDKEKLVKQKYQQAGIANPTPEQIKIGVDLINKTGRSASQSDMGTEMDEE